MRRTTLWARMAGALALLLSLTAVFFAAPAAAAQTGDSSIEVHNRICPTDYQGDTWFEDCHGSIPDPGLPFTFASNDVTRDGTTNENGNVGFANLPGGTWTVTGGAPGEFTDYLVYCSTENTDEQVPVDYVTGGIQFELAANTNLICDWYTIPLSQGDQPTQAPEVGESSIEVHERVCPTGYQGENWFEDCHRSPADAGMSFTIANGISQSGEVNADGDVGFANLPAGTYSITGGVPGEFAEHVVYCAIGTEAESDQEQIPVDYVTGGVQLTLPADTNVICDWYEIPYDLQGETPTATAQPDTFDLPIFALRCDAAPGDGAASDFVMTGTMPAGCEQLAGATVEIASRGDADYGSCETNATEPCYVTVDVGTGVVATIDLATLPADYTLVNGQSQEIEIPPASEAWVVFVAVPAVQKPVPTVAPTAPPVEGRTVTIHEGTCDQGVQGAGVAELTDLTGPEAGADSDTDVLLAETSSSTVGTPLDQLTDSENVVIAYADDATETPVACTAIDGQLNASGELVIGLQEVDDSGYAGIVYLAPTDDGSQTRISVFLVDGLAEEADVVEASTPAPAN